MSARGRGSAKWAPEVRGAAKWAPEVRGEAKWTRSISRWNIKKVFHTTRSAQTTTFRYHRACPSVTAWQSTALTLCSACLALLTSIASSWAGSNSDVIVRRWLPRVSLSSRAPPPDDKDVTEDDFLWNKPKKYDQTPKISHGKQEEPWNLSYPKLCCNCLRFSTPRQVNLTEHQLAGLRFICPRATGSGENWTTNLLGREICLQRVGEGEYLLRRRVALTLIEHSRYSQISGKIERWMIVRALSWWALRPDRLDLLRPEWNEQSWRLNSWVH